MPKVDVVVIALATPLKIGIYEEDNLIETFQSEAKSSDYLPELFSEILKRYQLQSITYANGPGSFMAIKMSYLFFKTLEVCSGIKLFAASAFAFNQSSPIKAMGKLYFHKNDSGIEIKPLEDQKIEDFSLPQQYSQIQRESDTAPNYVLPAVN